MCTHKQEQKQIFNTKSQINNNPLSILSVLFSAQINWGWGRGGEREGEGAINKTNHTKTRIAFKACESKRRKEKHTNSQGQNIFTCIWQ